METKINITTDQNDKIHEVLSKIEDNPQYKMVAIVAEMMLQKPVYMVSFLPKTRNGRRYLQTYNINQKGSPSIATAITKLCNIVKEYRK